VRKLETVEWLEAAHCSSPSKFLEYLKCGGNRIFTNVRCTKWEL